MSEEIEGIDREPVEAWFEANVDGAEPPLAFDRISGGRSNLTYGVTDSAGGRWALRRPPLGKALGNAHDMSREFKVHRRAPGLRRFRCPRWPASARTSRSTARPSTSWTSSRGRSCARPRRPSTRTSAGRSASAWSRPWSNHAVDPDAVGLTDLGRKEDYVERQLKRWQSQWEGSKTREVPLVEEVHDRLAERVPEQGPATIVHGDYRLDNMILAPSGEVAAVVDWELCTLGDPLADVGMLIVYWGDPTSRSCLTSTRPQRSPVSPVATRSRASTPSAPAATSRRSTSTSPSGSGSWR